MPLSRSTWYLFGAYSGIVSIDRMWPLYLAYFLHIFCYLFYWIFCYLQATNEKRNINKKLKKELLPDINKLIFSAVLKNYF